MIPDLLLEKFTMLTLIKNQKKKNPEFLFDQLSPKKLKCDKSLAKQVWCQSLIFGIIWSD